MVYPLPQVAGILEKLGRDDEAVRTMEAAYEMARASGRPADDPLVQQGAANLAGLKRHVGRKRQRQQEQRRILPADLGGGISLADLEQRRGGEMTGNDEAKEEL